MIYLLIKLGFGSLAINTHGLQTMEFIEKYNGPGNYTGSAVRVGAGVMFQDLYQAAWNKKNPVDVLGGECPVCHTYWQFSTGESRYTYLQFRRSELLAVSFREGVKGPYLASTA